MLKCFGINMQNRSMYPCTEECSQTLAICYRAGVIITDSAKTKRKPNLCRGGGGIFCV